MLDSFEILSTSGVVLWSKNYAPVGTNVVNSLIRDVFIEERVAPLNDASAAHNPPYKKDKYTLKWTTAKDFGLIFVAVYQSLLHLSWIDKLLDNVKTLFTSLYRNEFKKPHTSVIHCPFDNYFERQIQELEKSAGATTARPAGFTPESDLTPPSSAGGDNDTDADAEAGVEAEAPPPPPVLLKASRQPDSVDTSTDVTPIPTPDSSRPATPNSHIITSKGGPGGRASRRARKAAPTSAPISRDQSSSKQSGAAAKTLGKQKRRWGDDGMLEDGDNLALDYSAASPPATDIEPGKSNGTAPQAIEQSSWARKTGQGEVVLKDLDEEMESILSSASSKSTEQSDSTSTGLVGSGLGALSGLFRNVVGGKQLTEADLAKPLQGMEDHLVKKNVAREATVRLCEAVSRDLVGAKTASFQSIDNKIRSSMEAALTKILTPTSSLDLLRSIATHKSSNSKRPYVISVVGVNGVGKSTTLAKLAFLLLNNNYRVLVAGADTFRSGAVEQLRVHVQNLQSLIATTSSASNPLGHIDLYERGYGKDPAHIARDAVAFASSPAGDAPYEVVLIDTAGRRHNDSRLMSSLENFARLAVPDKIFMVGEALVGSDSVAQARHFNAAFGPGRALDGFIVSKCDTVGEMVGTVVSMVHATGVPVVAVGVGQHYGDLRGLNVRWCTRLLMQ